VIENVFKAALAAAAGAAFLWVFYHHWRGSAARAARRANYLDACQTLFDGGLKAVKPDGFPRISGTYQGHTYDLQVVVDTLNIRKLPTLWLLVTLPEALPVAGTFDVMMRPRGVETFSKFLELPIQIAPDAMFPHDCAIRVDTPSALPPRDVLLRYVKLLADDRVKELVISPKGLRIVWLADEAHRGKYLLFRDSEMALTPFQPQDLKPLLDGLISLREDILRTITEPAA
jgi:hypothetical protein